MNTQEHLLTVVMEECAELAQRCSKALRFGMNEKQPEQRYTNAERIKEEYIDLIGAIHTLSGAVPDFPFDSVAMSGSGGVTEKTAKIHRYMEYARECGTLKDEPEDGSLLLTKSTASCLVSALVSLERKNAGSSPAVIGTPEHTLLEVLSFLRETTAREDMESLV